MASTNTEPCASCRAERDRWLDTRPSVLLPRHGFAHGSGAAYDSSLPGIRDGASARHGQWRRTVRYQRALILAQCQAGNHV